MQTPKETTRNIVDEIIHYTQDGKFYVEVSTHPPHPVTIGSAKWRAFQSERMKQRTGVNGHWARDKPLIKLPSIESYRDLQSVAQDACGRVSTELAKLKAKGNP